MNGCGSGCETDEIDAVSSDGVAPETARLRPAGQGVHQGREPTGRRHLPRHPGLVAGRQADRLPVPGPAIAGRSRLQPDLPHGRRRVARARAAANTRHRVERLRAGLVAGRSADRVRTWSTRPAGRVRDGRRRRQTRARSRRGDCAAASRTGPRTASGSSSPPTTTDRPASQPTSTRSPRTART